MSEMDKTKYTIETLAPGLTMINDYSDSTSYLLEGSKAALLVDTGWGEGDFPAIIHGLTKKPVKLAITHAHGDHLLHAASFSPVYMHAKDVEILPMMNARFEVLRGRELHPESVTPISGGDIIDLGDGDVIEVLEMSGHTPGSAAFLWKNRAILFAGDAIGSGDAVWMQMQNAPPLSQYKINLQAFLAKLEPIDGLTIYGGHFGQAGQPGTPKHNPLSTDVIRDMITLCDLIVSGQVERDPYPYGFSTEQAYLSRYGRAGIVYLLSGAR